MMASRRTVRVMIGLAGLSLCLVSVEPLPIPRSEAKVGNPSNRASEPSTPQRSPSPTTTPRNSGPSLSIPFERGEELTYDLNWFGIHAGTAKITVQKKMNDGDRPVFHIVLEARSSPFISTFYQVDNRGESLMDAQELFSLYYRLRQREGNYRSDKEVTFDHQLGKAVYRKNNDPPESFTIPVGVQDTLSSFFYLRTQPLKVGVPVYMETFDSKKTWQLEIQILGRERLSTIWGETDTLLVKPLLKYEGIFQRKGDLYIWLTDDQRKLPVKMKSKIKIGSFQAALTGMRELN